MKAWGAVLALSLVGALPVGCASDAPVPVANGIFGELGAPLPSATPEQLAAFERGRAVALHRFTPEEGLGPEFNLTFLRGLSREAGLWWKRESLSGFLAGGR